MYAPFHPTKEISGVFEEKPQFLRKENSMNDQYVSHIFTFASTIPDDYLYWFSPPSKSTLTVSGESKAQILKQFRSAILNSQLEFAGKLGVELHCSGYFFQAFNILIEIIGSHIHIHNPNICSHIVERYRKFKNQLGLPKKGGTIEFPTEEDKFFFSKLEVQAYRSTLNCQAIRNFVMEVISLVCLSHQKEMSFPQVENKVVDIEYLCKTAISLNVGGKFPMKVIKKNELYLILEIIKKYLLYKSPKVEEAIYWVLWIIKFEAKCKRKGESLPCKHMNVEEVSKTETNHWIWRLWQILFSRLSYYPHFKKIQIVNIYALFKIQFSKSAVIRRLPLLFFAFRLLKYDVNNSFPKVINQLYLYIQACANVNVLYRNLQIRLARKSWVNVTGNSDYLNDENKIETNKYTRRKITKKQIKEEEMQNKINYVMNKTAYLDIIPKNEIP
jgi:hypothetical protein